MENLDYFKTRATVRNYSEKEVSDKMIKEMVEAASHAPTTGNMQLYSVIVTRDEEMKNALAPAHFNQGAIKNCSVALTFCADFNRFVKWCEQRDAVPGYDNFQSFVTALIDTTIFAQQFVTIAEMHGLGCCYLGTTTYNAPDIARILELKPRVVPVTTITIGWPATQAEVSDRLPVESILHLEKYHDYSEADINKAYAEKEQREDSERFIAENGKQTLAQVFTDVRYTRENNEYFSRVYKDFIQSQGYEID
jgi:nitroreductase